MSNLTRPELVAKLEKYFKKKVFIIVYNYFNDSKKDFIETGDEFYFRQFRDDVIKKYNENDCVLILNGPGGNVKTAIACSQILRDSLIRYDTFVPTVAGSSLCYFVLQSNRLLVGEKSILTQIDPLFNYQGKELRAIDYLNDSNSEIRRLAQDTFNPVIENLKRTLKNKPHVFEDDVSKECKYKFRYLGKMIDSWMLKKEHDAPLTIRELEKMKVRVKTVDEDIVNITKQIIDECIKELVEWNYRFVIQTSFIEEERYMGGYFYY